MPIFQCASCKCVENTALCRYWFRQEDNNEGLCSECDPRIKKWHGVFPKEPATGYVLLNDGFLTTKDYLESDSFKWRAANQGLKVVKIIE